LTPNDRRWDQIHAWWYTARDNGRGPQSRVI
jgi:hypothetical protein